MTSLSIKVNDENCHQMTNPEVIYLEKYIKYFRWDTL
jgi:hypothetical protein